MANNCVESIEVSVPAGETVDAVELELIEFKNIKWIVDVRDPTAEKVRAYEVTASYTISPSIDPIFSKYAEIGDDILHVFNMVYVPASNSIKVQITNNESNDLTVTIGEVERVE